MEVSRPNLKSVNSFVGGYAFCASGQFLKTIFLQQGKQTN